MTRYAKKMCDNIAYYISVTDDNVLHFYEINRRFVSNLKGPFRGANYNMSLYLDDGYQEITKEEFEAISEL